MERVCNQDQVKSRTDKEGVMEQIDLFSYTMPKYRIDKPVRLIELFAGIGSQAKALERLGVDFEHYKVIEWDKYAMASYNAIHGTNFETSDIQKIHASDLELREREILLHNDLFFPMPRLVTSWKAERYDKRKSHEVRLIMGS